MLPSVYTRCADAMSSSMVRGYGGVTWSATAYSGRHLGFARFLEDCADPDKTEWQCFELAVESNPAISREALDTLERGMTAEQVKVRRHGLTAFDSLAVYPQIDVERHVHEDRIEPSLTASIYYLYDPGAGHAAGHVLVYFEQDAPNTMHVWKAWEAIKETYDTEAQWVATQLQGRFLEAAVLDPNATRTEKRQHGFTSAAEGIRLALEKWGYSREKGTIKRGILLSERKSDELGSINSRKAGVTDVRQWLDEGRILFNPNVEDGGSLAVKRMMAHRFKGGTVYRGIGSIVDRNTEIPDCIRYGVRWRIGWRDRGPNPRKDMGPASPEQAAVEAARARGRLVYQRYMKQKRKKTRRRYASAL